MTFQDIQNFLQESENVEIEKQNLLSKIIVSIHNKQNANLRCK